MFKDFYKSAWKKTTPAEKKEVVKNTGDWFPEQHDNKIKGISDVAETYRENIMKRNNTSKHPKNKGNVIADCARCGKEFESYRGVGKYCQDCSEKVQKEYKDNYNATKKGKIVITPIGPADLRTRETASKRASNRGTAYLYELKRILDGTEPIRNHPGKPKAAKKQITKPVVIEEPKAEPIVETKEIDYLDTMEKAIRIVRAIKGTDNMKSCVDIVYEILIGE